MADEGTPPTEGTPGVEPTEEPTETPTEELIETPTEEPPITEPPVK